MVECKCGKKASFEEMDKGYGVLLADVWFCPFCWKEEVKLIEKACS